MSGDKKYRPLDIVYIIKKFYGTQRKRAINILAFVACLLGGIMQETKQGDLLKARFTIWLKKLILRAKIDYLRQNKGVDKISLDDYEESRFRHDISFNTAQDEFEFEEERINRAVSRLSKQRRNVLVRIYIQNMSAEEIAKESGVSVQHVYNQHSIALKQLKEILSKEKENEKP